MPTPLCLNTRGEEICVLPEHHDGQCTYTARVPGGVTEEQIALAKAFDEMAFAFMEEHDMTANVFLDHLMAQVVGSAVRSGETCAAFLARAAELYSGVSSGLGQKARLRAAPEDGD